MFTTHIIAAVILSGVIAGLPHLQTPQPVIRDLGPLPQAPGKGVKLPPFVDPDANC